MSETVTLNWGPQHPSSGHFRMVLTIDGDKVLDVVPKIGYTHRGIERLLENREYIPAIPMIERFCMPDTSHMNLPWALAVEDIMGADLTDRVKYLRTILCEIGRIASHLYNLALWTVSIGMYTPFMWAMGDREYFLRLAEMLTGVRLAWAYMLPGGVRADTPEGFEERTRETLDYFERRLDEYEEFIYDSPAVRARGEDVGVLTKEQALEMGATGPVLRGSGVSRDMRKREGYLAYDELDWDVVTREGGDSLDRMIVRFGEMRQSVRILRQCLDKIPGEGGTAGQSTQRTATVVRTRGIPAGKSYVRCEAARGCISLYLESRGGRQPYRAKFSTPSFRNGYLLPKLVEGGLVADVPSTYHSLDIWALEMDR